MDPGGSSKPGPGVGITWDGIWGIIWSRDHLEWIPEDHPVGDLGQESPGMGSGLEPYGMDHEGSMGWPMRDPWDGP